MQCLVSPKKFRDRLAAAADPLVQLKHLHPQEVGRLPESVGGQFDAVVHALTKHPRRWESESASYAAVLKLTPRQRAKIAADILDMFVTLSGRL